MLNKAQKAVREQQQISVPSDMASTPISHQWLIGVEASDG
jgi:hypothetical protein